MSTSQQKSTANRQQPVHQRYADVLQRVGRQVGYQHGHGQLGQLQLAQLPFAHQPHEKHQRKINYQRPDDDDRHGYTPMSATATSLNIHIIYQTGGSYERKRK